VAREKLSIRDMVGTAITLVPDVDKQRVEVNIADDAALTADSARIVQVIANFLANAARYGAGRIDICAFEDAGMTVIEVHDNGPGVPEVYELVIWERFERAAQRQSSIPGSGIGLAVARGVAHSHGGETYYRRSERLGGACFSIRVPIDHTVLRDRESIPSIAIPIPREKSRSRE
jgi:signal transduction histidine kinase